MGMSEGLDVHPAVSLPGEWTFWADMMGSWDEDARTWTPGPRLGPVDVAQFWCTSRLSGFGSGGAVLSLPCGIPSERLLRLWSWRLWCFYDNELYWCGAPSGIIDENGAGHRHGHADRAARIPQETGVGPNGGRRRLRQGGADRHRVEPRFAGSADRGSGRS